MKECEPIQGNQKNINGFLSIRLESRQFLLLVVITYTLLGIIWVWTSKFVLTKFILYWPSLSWWIDKTELISILVSSGTLAAMLWVHARAVYRKEKALEDSLALQQTVCSIDAELIADKGQEEILSAVCTGAVNLGHQLCWVGLAKPDGNIQIVANHGISQKYFSQLKVRWDKETAIGRGPAGRAIRSCVTVIFQDALQNPDFAPWREAAREAGFRAVAAIPIIGHKKVIGVLLVYNQKSQSFLQKDIFRLELLAQKASLAILASGRREAYETLSRQHELILDSVNEGIYGLDQEGKLTFLNRAASRMLGYTPQEVQGEKIQSLVHHTKLNGQPYSREECVVDRAIRQGVTCSVGEEVLWRKDGTSFPVELTTVPMRDGSKIVGAVVVFRDLTEIKRFKEQVANLSNYDLITGVYNRRRFQEELQRSLLQSKHFGTPGALLLIDVDNFKAINSTLGQSAADKLLIELVKILRGELRETDILGNLGGDEFGIILQGASKRQTKALADELLRKIRNHNFKLEGNYLTITSGIGIAYFSPEIKDTEELLIQGENALFQAKEQGFNRALAFNGFRKPLDTNWNWEYRLRRALEKEQFLLHFQPLVDIKNKQIVAYEALLRLEDEKGALVSPNIFLPWAERYGLIKEIDRWVMGKALELLASSNKSLEQGVVLGVNISGQTLADQEFKQMLRDALGQKLVSPGAIVLEITETAAVANLNEARSFIDSLKELGPRFALDDFGSGFSSLSYLKHLPVDFLKIDGSFIRDLPHNPVDQELVKFMVAMAKGLNKKTIAEFVQDGETVNLLKEIGVDYAQGYFFGKPGELP